MSGYGKVYLIGAGPGDPGLLTLRGKEIIEKADVVVYDRLVSPAILGFCNPKAKMVDVGKMPTHHKVKQSEINKLLVQFAGEFPGGVIARLKGGDPFVFGRGGEEALELVAAGVEFEVVPGITSAISVPAYAGIPVSHRGIATSFHIITGHEKVDESVCHPESKALWSLGLQPLVSHDPPCGEKDPGQNLSLDFDALAHCPGTLIFLMGIANMDFIAKRLMDCGKDPKTPLAFIEKGTTPYQRTVMATLETAAETLVRENVTAPAITIMGGVVELGKSLAWKKNLPLSGKRLVVTRAAKQASGISARLTALGAEVIETPMIETKTLDCPLIACHPESKTKDLSLSNSKTSKILTFSLSQARMVLKVSLSSCSRLVMMCVCLRARKLQVSERLPKRSCLNTASAAITCPKTTPAKASESYCLRSLWTIPVFSSFRAISPMTPCLSSYRRRPAGWSTRRFP